jgi:hypothetical protein
MVGKSPNATKAHQFVSVAESCAMNFSTVARLVGHVLGLLPTQSRPDRDEYVEVLNDNVAADAGE